MGPLIPSGERLRRLLTLIILSACATYAQTPAVSGRCAATAVPNQVRVEGLTEQMGDILLSCSGSNPGSVLAGNLSVFLPVSITNRIDANNQTQDAVLSVDYGNGFVPTGIAGTVSGQIIAFNGISFTVPPSGSLNIKISNLRGNVYQLGSAPVQPIQAQLIFGTPVSILVNQSQLTVAFSQRGLFTTLYDRGNIRCAGSPLPASATLSNLFSTGTAFSSARVTEGFAAAFQPRGPGETNGTRFLIKYSGFPDGARLFLPDVIAGSDAASPTSAGDLGTPQQVGRYDASSGGLLLVRVPFADANGAGGMPVSLPAGPGPVSLNSAGEVALTAGAGYAVYEVAAADKTAVESAQIPTFVGLSDVTAPAVAQESVTFAPVGAGLTASITEPVPRFAALPPASDCSIVGDCGASYFPRLSVIPNPVQLTGIAGGAMTSAPGYIPLNNAGGGIMKWTASVSYASGTGWLTIDPQAGQNDASIRIWAKPQTLAAGTYQATVTINAGAAGSVDVPLTLTVQPAPAAPAPAPGGTATQPPAAPSVSISGVVNAASFEATPVVAGSLATVKGQKLNGSSVSVSFDGLPASLLYVGDEQINLRVPTGVAGRTSTTMVVTVDGAVSVPQLVPVAPAWPSVFANGVLNQDNSVNAPGIPARRGQVLQIFATGIPEGATVSAQIGNRHDLVPLYAGEAPTVPGVQQVNLAIPEDLPDAPTPLALCVQTAAQQYCSTSFPLVVQ